MATFARFVRGPGRHRAHRTTGRGLSDDPHGAAAERTSGRRENESDRHGMAPRGRRAKHEAHGAPSASAAGPSTDNGWSSRIECAAGRALPGPHEPQRARATAARLRVRHRLSREQHFPVRVGSCRSDERDVDRCVDGGIVDDEVQQLGRHVERRPAGELRPHEHVRRGGARAPCRRRRPQYACSTAYEKS